MDEDRIDAGPAPTAADPPDEPPLDPAFDQAARDEEFRLFYPVEMPRLVGFLLVRGVEAWLAADIAQETMFAAYQRWNDIDAPRAWIRTVALRRAVRIVGQRHREEPTEDLPEPSGLLAQAEADEVVQRHNLVDRLGALPPAQREVMAFTFDGYQPTEIAGLLNKSAATVRSLLRQARATLQRAEEAAG